ncbi:MAG TPA: 3'(2'),5'-bisphosphate nucleotidase CysQ [Bacteroidia bacterium]|nr:3'(2'),5'-bisphosphate nucleotidase CysQ [Bacteroidia bacterium]
MLDSQTLSSYLLLCIKASLEAGKKILSVYEKDFSVERKADFSPLTEADKQSHQVIANALAETNLPVLSEEGRDIPYQERKHWDYFWMVDPLDGTKEFVKRNGEFTTNIALIHQQKSLLGVIYIPVKNVLYFACVGIGSFKCTPKSEINNLEDLLKVSEKLPIKNTSEKNIFRVLASRSHLSEATENFISELRKKYSEVEFVSSGSSIKFCLLAEGAADIYPRFAPTMEWDTAAGQAIVELAGKNILDCNTNNALLYNKENLLNNWFVAE